MRVRARAEVHILMTAAQRARKNATYRRWYARNRARVIAKVTAWQAAKKATQAKYRVEVAEQSLIPELPPPTIEALGPIARLEEFKLTLPTMTDRWK